ncbi:MAG: metal-binding protein [Cyanophyceae cyanobacterium]
MPLGSTHDRITLWTSPFVTLAAGILSSEPGVALATGSAYLFSGLMFSGDLDIRSRQYQRWTLLRWLWLPYRRVCRHRSIWSHGLIVGTVGRLLYVGLWLLPLLVGCAWLGSLLNWWPWQPQIWRSDLWQLIQVHRVELLWAILGLELGSINHSLSDWTVSGWKRSQKKKGSQKKQPLKHQKRLQQPHLNHSSRRALSRSASAQTHPSRGTKKSSQSRASLQYQSSNR